MCPKGIYLSKDWTQCGNCGKHLRVAEICCYLEDEPLCFECNDEMDQELDSYLNLTEDNDESLDRSGRPVRA
jgi:hypothetical protein